MLLKKEYVLYSRFEKHTYIRDGFKKRIFAVRNVFETQ
jgi:hypothetical protein